MQIQRIQVQPLWERAISECFLHETAWWDYIDWIKDRGLKLESVAVCSRSVRNHPSSVKLWTEYLFAAEWAAIGHENVKERILNRIVPPKSDQKSIQNGNAEKPRDSKRHRLSKEEVVDFGGDITKHQAFAMSKCQYFRRRVPVVTVTAHDDTKQQLIKEAVSTFEETSNLMDLQLWSPWPVPFTKMYSDFLCRFAGDISGARAIWEKMAKSKRAKDWSFWMAFIEWECAFGEMEPVVPALREQQRFQREHGVSMGSNENEVKETLKRKAFGQRNVHRIRKLYHRAIHILDMESGSNYLCDHFVEFEQRCGDLEHLRDAQWRCREKKRIETARDRKSQKRKWNGNEYREDVKRQKTTNSMQNTAGNTVQNVAANPVQNVATESVQSETPNSMQNKGTKEERSVFVVNFRKTMSRKDVADIFKPFGKVLSIKLPTDKNAKHRSKLRGFGYIEFADKESAEKCIRDLNHQEVRGKKLSVQHYRDNNSSARTVYVRGLKGFDHNEAEDAIHAVLDNCGKIKEIRLTKEQRRNDILRGFAYVEFENETAVKKALECSGTVHKGHVIEVKPYQSEEQREKQRPSKFEKQRPSKGSKKGNHRQRTEKPNQSMDIDHDDSPKVDRHIGSRKKRLKSKIEEKPNKSQDDFRALFGL